MKCEHLTAELFCLKNHADSLLRANNRTCLGYPPEEMNSWSKVRKERMLCMLARWHKRCMLECRTKPKNQKTLTDFFGFSVLRCVSSESDLSYCPATSSAGCSSEGTLTFDDSVT